MSRPLPLVLLVAALAGCAGYPAPPPHIAAASAPLPLDPSTISVPVSIRVPSAASIVDGLIPRTITSRGRVSAASPPAPGAALLRDEALRTFPGGGATYRYAFRRGPVAIRSSHPGDRSGTSDLEMAFAGTYAAEVASGSRAMGCGRMGTGEQLPFSVKIALRLVMNPDWSLSSTILSARARTPRSCALSRAIQPLAERFLGEAETQITAAIAEANKPLRENAETIWALASQPFSVAPDAWFVLQPGRLPFEAPAVDASASITFGLHFGLVARPQVVLGARPDAVVAPFPPLDANASPPSGFHVAVDVRVPFALLSQRITERLRGTPIRLAPLGTLHIESVEAYGTAQGRLVIRIGFSGAASGDAYFTGTPAFDRVTHVIAMPDLDFTVTTRNLLVNIAGPYIRSRRFISMLREKATYDASDVLAQNVAGVLRGFNHAFDGPPGTKIAVNGDFQSVEFGGVGIEAGNLVVRAIVDGNARVTIDAETGRL